MPGPACDLVDGVRVEFLADAGAAAQGPGDDEDDDGQLIITGVTVPMTVMALSTLGMPAGAGEHDGAEADLGGRQA